MPVEQVFFALSGTCGRTNACSWADGPLNPQRRSPAATFSNAADGPVLPLSFSLGLDRGGQFAQLAQEFLTEQVAATANICDPANATRMPDETVVGTLLNNRLLSTCTRTGMLAKMMEDARNQSGAGGNPGALLAFDFRALNNQCQIFLSGTQVFTASYSIPSARSIDGTIDGSGTATFTAIPNYNCNYFDDRPGFEQAFCAPVRAFSAPFAITAQWSSQSCTWEARRVDRIRN